jgi:hypothetical protein
LITRNCVPLALDGDSTNQEMVKNFFKRFGGVSNSAAVVTASGEKAGPAHNVLVAARTYKALPKKDRTRLDDLGKFDVAKEPSPPKGGLVLKVFSRGLERKGDTLRIHRNPRANLSNEASRDFLWLTADEWKSLVPARPAKGQTSPLPPSVANRLVRTTLVELIRVGGNGGARRPQDVVARPLYLTTEAVTERTLRLRLSGHARVLSGRYVNNKKEVREDRYDLLGTLEYDRKAGAFTRFDVVALSETGHFEEASAKLMPLGVALQLTPAKTPADRVRPSFYDARYYDTKK